MMNFALKIFEKLTDPKAYTGHHKHRFDTETGKGLGLDGRDRNVKGTGTELVAPVTANGDTLDIVHLMRPHLHNALTASSPSSPRKGSGGSPSAALALADRGQPATARGRIEGGRPMKSPRGKYPAGGSARRASEEDGPAPEVFNRLTDPARFTGHHKHRFDGENRGRGLAGRDCKHDKAPAVLQSKWAFNGRRFQV